jgi:serine/threonine-protein kinase HipA
MKPAQVIEVLLWGNRVGAVAADPALGCYAFAYDPAWKRRGIEVAPLTSSPRFSLAIVINN